MDPSEDTRREDTPPPEGTGVSTAQLSPALPRREASPQPKSAPEQPDEKQKPRTTGLKIVDAFIYGMNNIGVFALSVFTTYLTNVKGKPLTNDTSFLGKIRYGLYKRGNIASEALQDIGMSEGQAEMSKMVFFSWFDGTLVSPLVKLLEDRREKMAKGIDTVLGTRPEDDAAYAEEPKQSWGSVISGRFATAAVVVPTAVALSKTGKQGAKWIFNGTEGTPGYTSLNDTFFHNPGRAAGEWIKERPKLAKYFGKLDIPALGKISAFEGFYTTVCTIGMYFASRFIARKIEHKELAPAADVSSATSATAENDDRSRITPPPNVMGNGNGASASGLPISMMDVIDDVPSKKIMPAPGGAVVERLTSNELNLA